MNLVTIATSLKLVQLALTRSSDQELADLLAVEFKGNEVALQYLNQSFDADGVLVNSLKPNARYVLLQVAKQFSSILERTYQTFASGLTAKRFISGMLDPNLQWDDPTSVYVRETLGNFRFRRLYFENGLIERRD